MKICFQSSYNSIRKWCIRKFLFLIHDMFCQRTSVTSAGRTESYSHKYYLNITLFSITHMTLSYNRVHELLRPVQSDRQPLCPLFDVILYLTSTFSSFKEYQLDVNSYYNSILFNVLSSCTNTSRVIKLTCHVFLLLFFL